MKVIKQYNWRGELNSYIWEDMSVPIDSRNREYQIIIEAIVNGTCSVQEPEITTVTKTYTEDGKHSGFRCLFGFIPCDENNQVYKLIMKGITEGKCIVEELIMIENQKKVVSLISCIFFDRLWLGVDDVYHGKIDYQVNKDAASREYEFQFINLPTTKAFNKVELLSDYYQMKNSNDFIKFIQMPLQSGVLSIEIPVRYLMSLFRNELKCLDKMNETILLDQLSQHLLEIGRTEKRGPRIDWLLSNAKIYLTRMIQDIGNRIIAAFSMEYGTVPIGYIDRWKTYEEMIIINKYGDNTHELGHFGLQGKQNIAVTGWNKDSYGLTKMFKPEKNIGNLYHDTIGKVRMFIKMGLHMEALCLVNALQEIRCEELLLYWACNDNEMYSYIKNDSGYRKHLKIIKKLAEKTPVFSDLKRKAEFLSTLDNAEKIYDIRNEYIHGLKLPQKSKFLNAIQSREIEELLNVYCDEWSIARSGYDLRLMEESRELLNVLKCDYIKGT